MGRDLGFPCGKVRIAAALAPMCETAIGVDASASIRLEVARRRSPAVEFLLRDFTAEQDDGFGQFDLVTAFRFCGNAQPESRGEALRPIVRRLRAGGYLVINSHRNPRAIHALLGCVTGGPPHGMDLHVPALFGPGYRCRRRCAAKLSRLRYGCAPATCR